MYRAQYTGIYVLILDLALLLQVNYYPTISASIDGHTSKDALITHWRDGVVVKLQVRTKISSVIPFPNHVTMLYIDKEVRGLETSPRALGNDHFYLVFASVDT